MVLFSKTELISLPSLNSIHLIVNIYNKKYQVFISSTYTDLIAARNEVVKVLLDMHQLPIGMEMFSADNDEQWSVIQDTIDSSDYYILIVGQRYGSVTKEGTSYTEKEFDYAISIEMPVMVFVQDEGVSTKPEERESDPHKIAKLRAFREKVTTGRMVNFWKTESELALKVQTALTKNFTRHPRTGWVRASQAISPQIASEIAELSQENRKLKKELKEIQEQQNSRKPQFQLLADNKEQLEIEFIDNPEAPYRLLKHISSSHDFPADLRSSYNQSQVSAFNQQLAENEKSVEVYNTRRQQLNREITGSTAIKFAVRNVGNSKASELYTELSFPPELKVMKSLPSQYDNDQLPSGITFDPIKNAIESLNRRSMHVPFMQFGSSSRVLQNINIHPTNYTIADNKLTIKFSSLLHTRTQSADDTLYICPLQKGRFTIEVSFVCEELDKPQHQQFIVDVT